MIKIIAARGSYSHHLLNMLAVSTTLTSITEFFPLSAAGDSHSIRGNDEVSQVLFAGHFKSLMVSPSQKEKFVIIEPLRDHVLDYLDNSFSKESNYHFGDWIFERLINREQISKDYFSEIIEFLTKHQILNEDARTLESRNLSWLVREFLSYKIDELMFGCYERYFMLTYHSKITSIDFFENFESALPELVNSLGLEFKMPLSDIVEYNQNFIKKQKFHGIQKQCNQYINSVIKREAMENPCISIFDEAYVQSKLRSRGWEIMAEDLNKLPNSAELSKIIYPARLKGY